jgi:hypothetical protein
MRNLGMHLKYLFDFWRRKVFIKKLINFAGPHTQWRSCCSLFILLSWTLPAHFSFETGWTLSARFQFEMPAGWTISAQFSFEMGWT